MNKWTWTLVSERLPEKAGRYLCTSRWDKDSENKDASEWRTELLDYGIAAPNSAGRANGRCFGEFGFGELWSDGIDNIEEVIAWMPLPEPCQIIEEGGE